MYIYICVLLISTTSFSESFLGTVLFTRENRWEVWRNSLSSANLWERFKKMHNINNFFFFEENLISKQPIRIVEYYFNGNDGFLCPAACYMYIHRFLKLSTIQNLMRSKLHCLVGYITLSFYTADCRFALHMQILGFPLHFLLHTWTACKN